jgi:hypothetical protein
VNEWESAECRIAKRAGMQCNIWLATRACVCVCVRARVLQDLTPKSLRKAAKFLSDSRCWSIPVLSSAALPAPSADASAAAFAAACEEVGSVTFALCLRCGAVRD